MSSIIESGARAVKNLIPGISSSRETQIAQAQRGRELIKNLALGGLAVGGTAGAAVVLNNYLRSLGQEAELNDESRLNDDTLYLPMPEKAAADGPRWSAPGLAVTGGVLSAGAAYAITQALYNMIQKKRHTALLDEAQGETLAVADEEFKKSSALGMTFPELVAAFPVALPLLAALASGGVTYTALNKAFPTVGVPKSKYPKRIRAVAGNGQVSDLEEEEDGNVKDVTKSAADRAGEEDCELAGLEFVTLLTAQISLEKKAEHRLTADIVNTVARDGVAEVASVYETGGLLGLVDSVKNAAETDEAAKVAAVVLLHRHPRLSPIVASLAAAEYQELVPTVMSKCASMDSETLDKVAGVAALFQLTFMRPMLLKEAAIPPMLMQQLSAILGGGTPQQAGSGMDLGADDRDAAMTSDASGSMAEENEGGGDADDGMDEESQSKNDAVDSFFEDPAKAPGPRA